MAFSNSLGKKERFRNVEKQVINQVIAATLLVVIVTGSGL
jgi:hypothetical protein